MKLRQYLLLITGILSIEFLSCNSSAVSKNDQYKFLNWYVENYHPENLSDKLIPIENFGSSLTQIYNAQDDSCKFSKEDRLFISQQVISNNKIKILSKADFRNANWKEKKVESSTNLSLPVFSKDKTIVIINRWYYCGMLCDDGGMEVFKWKGGHWKKITLHIPHIVS